jgi:hypothetical protein
VPIAFILFAINKQFSYAVGQVFLKSASVDGSVDFELRFGFHFYNYKVVCSDASYRTDSQTQFGLFGLAAASIVFI